MLDTNLDLDDEHMGKCALIHTQHESNQTVGGGTDASASVTSKTQKFLVMQNVEKM